VPLQFNKIVVAKNFTPFQEELFGFLNAFVEDGLRYFGPYATGGSHQTAAVLTDQLLVDPRVFLIEAVDIAQRTQFAEVAVTFCVFGEDELVMAVVAGSAEKFAARHLFHYIEFTTQHRLDTYLFGCFVKLEGTEHVAVIGQCHGFHAIGFGFLYHVVDRGLTVEEGILRMYV